MTICYISIIHYAQLMIFCKIIINPQTKTMCVVPTLGYFIRIHLIFRTVFKSMHSFFIRQEITPSMPIGIKKIRREFISRIKKTCTLCQICIILLIVFTKNFTLQRWGTSISLFQTDINHCSTHLITCRCRIHNLRILNSASRNRL